MEYPNGDEERENHRNQDTQDKGTARGLRRYVASDGYPVRCVRHKNSR
jgi:hypothetical protein